MRVELLPDDTDTSGIQLALWRYGMEGGVGYGERKPVLLLHGASANHRTFIFPDGGLAACLVANNLDPWLLDWRGSGLVVDENEKSLSKSAEKYTFNLAARHDVRRAIRTIKKFTGAGKVSALGFCMGSAVLAEAVALGHIGDDDVDRLVLMTLGLFYETPIDGRLKSDDRILERLKRSSSDENPFLCVDPRVANGSLRNPWPPELDEMYNEWPKALRSHAEPPKDSKDARLDPVVHMCNRLSFMYGMPYDHNNLVEEVHGAPNGVPALPEMFGAIPLQMYIHGARNIRYGQATYFDSADGSNDDFVSEKALERFRRLEKVTLITGALNRLWHRDSIDLMHEWLTRGSADHLSKFQKHVLRNYGHQDLLWGKASATEVFPAILTGLGANSEVVKIESSLGTATSG